MPPASLRRTVSSPVRHEPVPKDSRAARAARRERFPLAEIELWRSVAGQTSPAPSSSRRSSASSAGSYVDENGSIADSSIAEEQDTDDLQSVADTDAGPSPSQQRLSPPTRRRPLRPAQQPTIMRTLRPLPGRSASFAGFSTPVVTPGPEIRSLELEVSHLTLNPTTQSRRPIPTTPRRRSSRLRL
ncbi:hypothetical protein RhiJN_13829 [Ceratobasidium sp. AG-Ba]|nr:hypothetical protein RhiJN_13829 [Ceratobasidium sp. AG-Ba]QRW14388.1 hypothetical protein RhiLY_13387 [Ceratobasidium sp. AG-Ba]